MKFKKQVGTYRLPYTIIFLFYNTDNVKIYILWKSRIRIRMYGFGIDIYRSEPENSIYMTASAGFFSQNAGTCGWDCP